MGQLRRVQRILGAVEIAHVTTHVSSVLYCYLVYSKIEVTRL